MKLEDILDEEDRALLHKKTDGDVKCPKCNKPWHSPHPTIRKVCPKCFEELTGFDYID